MSVLIVTTFYKIIELPYYKDLRAPLLGFCQKHGLRGTILLTPEGINATISGSRESVDALYHYMQSYVEFAEMEYKESQDDDWPFQRMKVLLKDEVVAMRVQDLNMKERGVLVEAERWDELIKNPKLKLIDTRNDFEVAFGTFFNAINPKTQRFSDFAAWAEEYFKDCDRNTPIAMFCTGGIRCEKSTAYMKKLGFQEVYHLKGGILKYLEDTGNRNKMWYGSCFVFDDRLALDDALQSIEGENV